MTIILPFLSAALLALPTLTLADLFDDAVSQASQSIGALL